MLYYLEHFLDGEVLEGFEAAVEPTPGKGRAVLPVGLELEQGVVDAVEEDLVVDVLALRQEVPRLTDRWGLVRVLGHPLVLPAPLQL